MVYFNRNEYFPEDEFNGLHGAYSPEAMLNQANNRRRSGGQNPYDVVYDHASDFGSTTGAGAGGAFLPGGSRGGGPTPAPPPTPPPYTGFVGGDPASLDWTKAQPGPTSTPVATPTDVTLDQHRDTGNLNPTTGKPYGRMPSGNVPPALWQEVDRWVQGGLAKGWDYSYLYDHPELVSQFRQWQQANNAQNVDPVDWLKAMGYVSPGAGRNNGVDTYAAWKSQQTTTGPAGTPPAPPNLPPGQPAPPPGEYLADLDRQLRARQDLEQQNALRSFRSAAGATGLQNTGAYLPGQMDLVAELATRFGTQRAQAMLASNEAERARAFQASQSELDRTLQQYGIDVNAYTSRFNTTTEAGVQMAAQRMQYDLGLRGIQVDQDKLAETIRNNTLGYNLGVGQQDLTRYQTDQSTRLQLLDMMRQIGPEAFFAMLFGNQAPPSFIGFQR